MKHYEIELKFQLEPATKELFLLWLHDHAQQEKTEQHRDHYLDHPQKSFLFDSPLGFKDYRQLLRVRAGGEGEGGLLTTKLRSFDADQKTITAVEEYQTEVQDAGMTLEVFKLLGYQQIALVQKKRTYHRYKDFEIAIDVVEQLGSFFEVECQQEGVNPAEGVQLIYQFLAAAGIDKVNLVERGYLNMMLNPDHAFGRWQDV